MWRHVSTDVAAGTFSCTRCLRHPSQTTAKPSSAKGGGESWLDAYDCAVIVSNDSDLADSLRLVKEQHKKLIGLITPGAPLRKTSRQLAKYADFIKPIRT